MPDALEAILLLYFFLKTLGFLIKTKVVELELLYKTGVHRGTRLLSDDGLCPKYFLSN